MPTPSALPTDDRDPPDPEGPLIGPDPAALAGDAEAWFDRLFQTHYVPLCRFAYRLLRDWEGAEDVVHDVFVQVWAHRDALTALESPGSYLYSAARNRALSRLRHLAYVSGWQQRESARSAHEPALVDSPERELARRETTAALQQAVDQLPLRQREVLLLRWRGRSYDEIAAELGISPKTVSVHLSRAFDTLRTLLESERD